MLKRSKQVPCYSNSSSHRFCKNIFTLALSLSYIRLFSRVFLIATFLPLCLYFNVRAQSSNETVTWNKALEQESGWYSSAEAIRIADNVLLYQHENGGWPKNIDMAQELSTEDKARMREEKAGRETTLDNTTIDNGATYTQMRYLAKMYEATEFQRFKDGFLQGLDYLLEAQYENGGWPQYHPIREGYYEHITFNDGAMINVMLLLRNIAEGETPYRLVDTYRRQKAATANRKGLDVILKTQIEVDGKLTGWCAQYDQHELTPQKARSYELVSISGAASVDIVQYLIEIEDPGPEIIRAVESAVEWLERVKLSGIRMIEKEAPSLPRGYDRVVVFDPSAPPLWARFYEIGTNRPMFVGRDGIVQHALSEIEYERRVGYRWLGDWAQNLLEQEYPAWHERRNTHK